MSIEAKLKELQDAKYREDLERGRQTGVAQAAATQVENNIAKLAKIVAENPDPEIAALFQEFLAFYNKDRLLEKEYAAALFVKSQALQKVLEEFAEKLVS